MWGEVELAWRLRDPAVPWLAVTGTNGKTTTVRMLGQMLRAAGLRVAEAGNVGDPVVSAMLDPRSPEVVALELSSFQLHRLTGRLMAARRAVAAAQRAGSGEQLRAARAAVHEAKVALGERGPVWWEDGAPDYNRRLVENTPYASWYETLLTEAGADR